MKLNWTVILSVALTIITLQALEKLLFKKRIDATGRIKETFGIKEKDQPAPPTAK